MAFSSTEILLFATFILGLIYLWLKYQFSYWTRKNIAHIPPTLILGNLKDIVLMKNNPADSLRDLYNYKTAENEPVLGIHVFHTPALLIREPELIKRILIKDFNKFSNRYSRADPHSDKIGAYNLFFLRNQAWKQMRSKLSPLFTSGKMKQMFTLVNDIGKQLDLYLSKLPMDPKKDSSCVEVKNICALFTTDVIASTVFGIQANSLENPDGDFRKHGKKNFIFTPKRALEMTLIFFIPKLVNFFKSKIFVSDLTNFIRSTIDYVMKEREKSGISRNDLIDTLITLKNASAAEKNPSDKNELRFEGEVLFAQAAVFFAAGYETSSSVMSFALYELSKYPEMQNRLRDEIREVLEKNNGDITYEVIQNMEYLNMIIQETLRMYPPLPFLDRECTLDSDESGYSLEPFSKFQIPNEMPVYIPVYAIQRDPKYFPNPDQFDPERFSPQNKNPSLSTIYMPFGIGPHNCIGERFGVMQTRVGLIHFFKNHYVRPSDKSPKTMKLDKKALVIQPEGGIHCEIIRNPLFK